MMPTRLPRASTTGMRCTFFSFMKLQRLGQGGVRGENRGLGIMSSRTSINISFSGGLYLAKNRSKGKGN